ncbi:hypothetical protein ACN47E_003640 [Coniothyrium glycines]
MAVLEGCAGLEVSVTVNEQALKEYEDDSEDSSTTTATRYIEAQSGQSFAIKYSFTAPFPTDDPVVCRVSIDGNKLRRRLTRAKSLYKRNGHCDSGPHSTIGTQSFKQSYMFRDLHIHEETTPISKEILKSVAKIGTITVEFQYAKNVRKSSRQYKSPKSISTLTAIPEKAMKGEEKSHQVGLSERYSIGARSFSHWDLIGDAPFASFNFKYRSLAALRALHIVPRELTPIPLEDRPTDDLSPEEMRQLIDNLRARQASSDVKKESNNVKEEGVRKRAISISSVSDGELEIVESRSVKRHRADMPQQVIELD